MVTNAVWGEGRRLFRDPVHGFIALEQEEARAILPLIDSPRFQRLRRISQLGTSRYTYHGAEHSRFGHSMGTMWNMRNLIKNFAVGGVAVEESESINGTAAALLHDLGHGPLSHVFEQVTDGAFDHEAMTRTIIEQTEVKDLLENPRTVLDILKGLPTPENRWLSEAISGPLDVDKMDYLLRDSHFCGVEYGLFDFDRLFNVLRPVEFDGMRHLGIQLKGVQAAEGFVLARDRMYWAVYFHKTTRGAETLVSAILRRAKDLQEGGTDLGIDEGFATFLSEGNIGVDDFQNFDDTSLTAYFKGWTKSPDSILSDLCKRFFDRRLFKGAVVTPEQMADALEKRDEIHHMLQEQGLDDRYYFANDNPAMSPYDPGGLNDEGSKIIVETNATDGAEREVYEISRYSRIIRLLRDERKTELRVYSTATALPSIMSLLA